MRLTSITFDQDSISYKNSFNISRKRIHDYALSVAHGAKIGEKNIILCPNVRHINDYFYEFQLGYKPLANLSRSASSINSEIGEVEQIRSRGLLQHHFLDAGSCQEIIERARRHPDYSDEDGTFLKSSPVINEDRDLTKLFVSQVLSGKTDSIIKSYFKSNYTVLKLQLSRTVRYDQSSNHNNLSYKWHTDASPMSALKILFYLNGYDEHGGGTAFIEKPVVKKLDEIGYTQYSLTPRLDDIQPLAEYASFDYTEIFSECVAGEGFFFEPSNTLHKGVAPTKGPRWVIQCFLAPFPIAIEKRFDEAISFLQRNDAVNYPNIIFNWEK